MDSEQQVKRKCELVKAMSQEYPVTTLCQIFEMNRSSFYYQSATNSDDEVKHTIAEIAAEHPTYGYWRITAMLHQQGQIVNNKCGLRLIRDFVLGGQMSEKKVSYYRQ
ncbi:IS3 family transposase [Microcoleus sp. FACHB-1515]|uniref:IS3 family transposase n=2 Tax=Cyanophyceae TaxID=3028117 RepID=UPI001A7E4BFF|nr:IS3 family transposase [Microcoleus sp. FACHB-1515]